MFIARSGRWRSRRAMGSDEQLLAQFLEGDEKAFEELVRRHEASLRKLAFGFVRDWAAAEDVAQDTFIRAYRKASSFRRGGTVKAWLYRIAINRAKDELRGRRRKREVAWEGGLDNPTEVGPAGSAEALVAARELGRHIAMALEEMEGDYRTVLVLREIEGMTYREIAELLGLPMGTVQTRIHRGRLALRFHLKKYLE